MVRKRLSLKKAGQYRAVFLLNIDFTDQIQEPLMPGYSYNFPGNNRINKHENGTMYSEIVDYVVNTINTELKPQCQECCNIPIEEIKVIKTYHGSIHVIFTTIFSALGVVSGLKDLYDSIELIKVMSQAHVKNKLKERYGVQFRVRIDSIVPDDNRYHRRELYYPDEIIDVVPVAQSNRDAFFYYLLISNIVLLVLLGLLVYKAVITMYW